MADPTTDHRRATAERNVEAILDATEALLERRAPTSIAAVAGEAGVSRVTVYAHFASREELLEAVVERAVGHAAAALDAARPDEGPPLEALERLVAAAWRELARNAATARAAAEQLSPEALTRSHETAARRVRELADRGRAEGAFRTDLPAEWLVATTLALVHACSDEVRAGRLPAGDAERALTTTLRDLYTRA